MTTKSIRSRLMASTMAGGAALLALTAVPAITLLAPTSAYAQSQTGALRVAVTGESGQPLAGATVTVSSPDSLVTRSGTTDEAGRVRLTGLDPATNYTVQISAPNYDGYTASNVAVVSGQERAVGYALGTSSLEDIIVTGTSLAAVDVTSATVGTTLTLDTVESLPTGRNYQSYLQLVPGVKPSSTGNPSSRSGVNYADLGGATGVSTDNLYYLDGVDVTDPVDGTFGANFNSEIIQEQQVLVGAIPAEYAGGAGLVSRVITKSGSNEWHGSINYYFQNDSLVSEDKHDTSNGFSTYDTAFTIGGPIVRDRLWIFGSYQKKHREDDVLDPVTGDLRRSVASDSDYGFVKATWQATDNDRLTIAYFSDPTEISGTQFATTINRRDYSRVQGGDNYKIDYAHTWGDLLVNAYWFRHEAELSDLSIDKSIRDNVSYRSDAGATIEQRQLGGRGYDIEDHRDREEFGANFEYYLDTGFGSHTFKGGYLQTENVESKVDSVPGGATYASIALPFAGTTFADYTNGDWTSRSISAVDANRIISAANKNAAAKAVLDTDANGTITAAELGAYQFTSTAGNPYGNVNAYRSLRVSGGSYEISSEGRTFYLQDTWTRDQLTVNAGVRAEKWEHVGSDGSKIASFDWTYAPRLSVVYDVLGDGRSKVFGFAGRYYDPIRNDMTDFAGASRGPRTDEQIFIGNQWVTFRTRGPGDSIFAPTVKTPYTDEFLLGASTTFGDSVGLSASVTRRVTEDLLEDYDLGIYSNPNGDTSSGHADEDSLFYIPLSYFGFDTAPNTNYVIGTLLGGKREYTGFELTVTKFKTSNWFGQMSYTFNDAKGNSNSDGNADYQGDWIALDPRAPNVWGPQAGNIAHQFKAFGSYEFDFGLELSGVFNWNSGELYTPASPQSGRYFAPMDQTDVDGDGVADGYYYGGVRDTYLLPGYVGAQTGPSYYTFDMRLKYVLDMPIGETEFFLDVFNVFDHQAATSLETQVAGSGIYDYQEPNSWVAPRRAYLGVRYSF